MQIVFLDSDTIPNPLPVPTWATKWTNCPATAPGAEAAIQALGAAQLCITNKVKITAEVLAGAPNLKFVCVAATGYDCVDLHACRTHGVVAVGEVDLEGFAGADQPLHVAGALKHLVRNTTRGRQLTYVAEMNRESGQHKPKMDHGERK